MLTDIEIAALEGHRKAKGFDGERLLESGEGAIYFGLRLLLDAGRMVREHRLASGASAVDLKEDGSPVTALEERVERHVRDLVEKLDSGAVVVGEETGGDIPEDGLAFAVDPIDGTWAFLSESETYSTTLALIRDGRTSLGMVSNPVTGEIAYCARDASSRLVRLSLYGEPDEAHSLRGSSAHPKPLLVNVHPNRRAREVVSHLYRAWSEGEVAMVRSPGGSPAWAMVEAARGHFTYVNIWSREAAKVFDLAAGAAIVRGAGGDVVGFDGLPIDCVSHRGPFVAGRERRDRDRVRALLEGIAVE